MAISQSLVFIHNNKYENISFEGIHGETYPNQYPHTLFDDIPRI